MTDFQAPAPAPEEDRQLGSDREIALMEGHRIPAVDAYFNARQWMDGTTERKAYEDGYQRGWRDSNKAHPVQAPAVGAGWKVQYFPERDDGPECCLITSPEGFVDTVEPSFGKVLFAFLKTQGGA